MSWECGDRVRRKQDAVGVGVGGVGGAGSTVWGVPEAL